MIYAHVHNSPFVVVFWGEGRYYFFHYIAFGVTTIAASFGNACFFFYKYLFIYGLELFPSQQAHLHLVGMSDINQLSLPTPYSVLVSVSVFMALSTVFLSIYSSDSSPLFRFVLSVLFVPYWSFQIYISYESLPQPWYDPLWSTGLKAPTN